MFRTALTTLAVLVAAVSVADAAQNSFQGKPKRNGFAVFDQNTGEKVFDDGKLDGLGCVVGKKAVFDKNTGQIKQVPAFKCNFDNQ